MMLALTQWVLVYAPLCRSPHMTLLSPRVVAYSALFCCLLQLSLFAHNSTRGLWFPPSNIYRKLAFYPGRKQAAVSPLWNSALRRSLPPRVHHRFGARQLWPIASLNPPFTLRDAWRHCLLILSYRVISLFYRIYYPTLTAVAPGVAYGGDLSNVEHGSVGHGEAPYTLIIYLFCFIATFGTAGVRPYNPYPKHLRCRSATRPQGATRRAEGSSLVCRVPYRWPSAVSRTVY